MRACLLGVALLLASCAAVHSLRTERAQSKAAMALRRAASTLQSMLHKHQEPLQPEFKRLDKILDEETQQLDRARKGGVEPEWDQDGQFPDGTVPVSGPSTADVVPAFGGGMEYEGAVMLHHAGRGWGHQDALDKAMEHKVSNEQALAERMGLPFDPSTTSLLPIVPAGPDVRLRKPPRAYSELAGSPMCAGRNGIPVSFVNQHCERVDSETGVDDFVSSFPDAVIFP
jgi:hypothetical protein